MAEEYPLDLNSMEPVSESSAPANNITSGYGHPKGSGAKAICCFLTATAHVLIQVGRMSLWISKLMEALPDFDSDAVWQAVVRLRGWQQGVALLSCYNDPANRPLLKPEAVFELETGLRQSA